MNTKDLVIGKVQTLMDTMKSVTLNISIYGHSASIVICSEIMSDCLTMVS